MVHLADYIVIVLYFAIIGTVGLWRARKRQRSTEQYFVANRSIPGWAVAFTLMATLISTGTVIGHPATVYRDGMILLLGNAMLLLVLVPVAWWIVPFYRNTVRMSAYEYLGKRFGMGGRFYSSIGFLADRIFDLGVTLLLTAMPIYVMIRAGLPQHMADRVTLPWIIFVVGLCTVLYTAVGGAEAVVWTDVVQGVILLAAPVIILAKLLFFAPEAGPDGSVIYEAYRNDRFHLGSFELSWASLFSSTTTQWLIIVAYTINFGRRYIADQHMVQRYLLARSDREAMRGAMWNALMCVPIWAAFMFVGACLFGYYSITHKPGPSDVQEIVPHFILNEMPVGPVGVIIAAILAASMSTVAGDLNSVSTVLTTDYFAHFLPRSSDRARLRFGQSMVITAGMVAALVALLLAPSGDSKAKSVMERAVTISAILSGGTLGLFMLGFLTRRATREGCYIGIAACLLFTTWGILTEGAPDKRIVNLPINFTMNPILIGVFGHVILFVVGYIASIVIGGYRPADVEQLTFRWKKIGPA